MEYDLTLFTLEDYIKISQIAVEQKISMKDAGEIYAKQNPGKIKSLGVLQEDGKVRQTEISEEGVETKEVELDDFLEDLTNGS